MTTTTDPVTFDEIHLDVDGTTATWNRESNTFTGDEGLALALAALVEIRQPLTVLQPNVEYDFPETPLPAAAATAAMLGVSGRGRIIPYDAVEQLLAHLGVDDEDDDDGEDGALIIH